MLFRQGWVILLAIALIVGLGTVLGKMMVESGGAERGANPFWIRSEQKVHWAMMIVAFKVDARMLRSWVVLLIPIILYDCKKNRFIPFENRDSHVSWSGFWFLHI